MFEVRFENSSGTRWRAGWWLATIGVGLMVLGLVGGVVAPQVSHNNSEGVVYFGIGVAAATIGFVAFIVGRNLMFRRIVSPVIDENDTSDE